MIKFDLWSETFIFGVVYAVIIIIPCILVALMGRKMIDRLGMYPTKTPVIQMGIFLPLIVVEVITFSLLIGFFQFFTSQ